MIPISTKKCKKSNESKEKVVDLACKKKFTFSSCRKAQKKSHSQSLPFA
jgi:hypothetical protein